MLDEFDCGRSLCGCQRPLSLTVIFKLTNKDSTPVDGATLVCLDDGESIGVTNSEGLLTARVKGLSSPGCGFQSDCRTAYFQIEDGGRERPFWFSQIVRGGEVDPVGRKIQVVKDSR